MLLTFKELWIKIVRFFILFSANFDELFVRKVGSKCLINSYSSVEKIKFVILYAKAVLFDQFCESNFFVPPLFVLFFDFMVNTCWKCRLFFHFIYFVNLRRIISLLKVILEAVSFARESLLCPETLTCILKMCFFAGKLFSLIFYQFARNSCKRKYFRRWI